jgi:hypothetical protein
VIVVRRSAPTDGTVLEGFVFDRPSFAPYQDAEPFPVAGVTVRVGVAHSTTDSAGHYRVTNISGPSEISVVDASGQDLGATGPGVILTADSQAVAKFPFIPLGAASVSTIDIEIHSVPGRGYSGRIVAVGQPRGAAPDLEVRVEALKPQGHGTLITSTADVVDPCPRGPGACTGRTFPTAWRLRNVGQNGLATLYENGIEVDHVDLSLTPVPDLHAIFPPPSTADGHVLEGVVVDRPSFAPYQFAEPLPVAGVTVRVAGAQATTDETGRSRFTNLEAAGAVMVVDASGVDLAASGPGTIFDSTVGPSRTYYTPRRGAASVTTLNLEIQKPPTVRRVTKAASSPPARRQHGLPNWKCDSCPMR